MVAYLQLHGISEGCCELYDRLSLVQESSCSPLHYCRRSSRRDLFAEAVTGSLRTDLGASLEAREQNTHTSVAVGRTSRQFLPYVAA